MFCRSRVSRRRRQAVMPLQALSSQPPIRATCRRVKITRSHGRAAFDAARARDDFAHAAPPARRVARMPCASHAAPAAASSRKKPPRRRRASQITLPFRRHSAFSSFVRAAAPRCRHACYANVHAAKKKCRCPASLLFQTPPCFQSKALRHQRHVVAEYALPPRAQPPNILRVTTARVFATAAATPHVNVAMPRRQTPSFADYRHAAAHTARQPARPSGAAAPYYQPPRHARVGRRHADAPASPPAAR